MWVYEKRLQYPVKIKTPNAKLAKIIISQYLDDQQIDRMILFLLKQDLLSYAINNNLIDDAPKYEIISENLTTQPSSVEG